MKTRNLTAKQQRFVAAYIDNGGNATKAAQESYGTPGKAITYASARQIGSDNLTKPNIKSNLSSYSELIESKLIGTIKDWGSSDKPREREIAMDVAKYTHDKVFGKARQSIDLSSKHIELMIDLTGGKAGPIPKEVLAKLD